MWCSSEKICRRGGRRERRAVGRRVRQKMGVIEGKARRGRGRKRRVPGGVWVQGRKTTFWG